MRRVLTLGSTLVLVTAFGLVGCGFHLRGKIEIADEMRVVNVRDISKASDSAWESDGHDGLQRTTVAAFTGNGFVVTDGAPVTVELLNETLRRSIASIAANASAAEYQIDYALEFRISAADGSALVPATTIKIDRSYRYHEDAAMGSAEEEAMLYRDLRRDAVGQIIRQYRRGINHRAAMLPAATDAPAP